MPTFLERLGRGLRRGSASLRGTLLPILQQREIEAQQAGQQDFLNRIRQERLDLAKERFELEKQNTLFNAMRQLTQPDETPADRALRLKREAEAARIRKEIETSEGQDGGQSSGGQQKIPLGSFIQNFLKGRERVVPGTEESLFPVIGQAPITPAAVDTLTTLIQQLQTGSRPIDTDLPQIDTTPGELFPSIDASLQSRQRAIEFADQDDPSWREMSPQKQEEYLQWLIANNKF